ncbi:MAG: helix-turn-helix domain-containing protein, partial [Planctomycetes bacterium]|nr:helix-turn-helix domain-containing protein [Planctomycetota bacterium]
MPWIKTCPMTERREFISAWLREGNVAGLVRRFLVSRKTAYKWIARYRS